MNKKKQGFTIVELVLAMALVTFIFLFTLTVLTQLLTTYNRGLALTQINQAIRQLDNDVGKGLRFSSPGAFNSKYYDSGGSTTMNLNNAVAGVFCTGTVAYVWNVRNNEIFTYEGTVNEAVRLVRIAGASADGVYCAKNTKKIPKGSNSVVIDSLTVKSEDVTNLLGSQAMVLRAEVSGGDAISAHTHECLPGKYHDYTDSNRNGDREECVDIPLGGVINERGRLAKVYFALSTAGGYEARWESSDGGHWTCESTAHTGQYCSFGEFNSVVYLRGK